MCQQNMFDSRGAAEIPIIFLNCERLSSRESLIRRRMAKEFGGLESKGIEVDTAFDLLSFREPGSASLFFLLEKLDDFAK